MMVKGGWGQVVSDHSGQSFRSNSSSPSKTPSECECEIPCKGDLLVIRRMLGTIPKPLDDVGLLFIGEGALENKHEG